MSKITFLGTAGTFDALKSGRSSGGIVIEADDLQLHIDPGIGSLIRASQANIDLSKTDIVLATSSRLLYSNDINAVAELAKDSSIICSKELLKHEESALTKTHAKMFSKVIADDDEARHLLSRIEVNSIKTKDDVLAFRIHTSKFIMGYVPTSRYSRQLFKDFKDVNILILSCDDDLDKKLLVEFIEEVNPELAILTCFGEKIIKEDPLEFSRNIKRILQADKKIVIKTQVIPAKDGMIINPENYNIKIRQKKLERFF